MPGYEQIATQRLMLCDRVRNEAYRAALSAAIKPGAVVLDVGAGTGILSFFAAQCGASRVYAVERTSIARLARRLAQRNGFGDRISVIRGNVENVTLPEPVDVIVSEWLGTLGVDENMLGPVLLARDRWLKPDGRLLPAAVTAWMAPVWDSDLDFEMQLRAGRPYELDLSPVADRRESEMSWAWMTVDQKDLPSAPQPLWITNVREMAAGDAMLPFKAELSFTMERESRINAFTTWFVAQFDGDVTLTNSPTAPMTHWGRHLFPLRRPLQLDSGTPIDVKFACIPAGPGYSTYEWSARIGDGDWEHHDS